MNQVSDAVKGNSITKKSKNSWPIGNLNESLVAGKSENKPAVGVQSGSSVARSSKNKPAIEGRNGRTIAKKLNKFKERLDEEKYFVEKNLEFIRGQIKNVIPEIDTNNMYIAIHDHSIKVTHFPVFYINGQPGTVKARKLGEIKNGRTEEILINGEPIFIPTLEESIAWYDSPEREEHIDNSFASFVGVPLKINGKVTGVVAAFHPKKNNVYNDDNQKILQGVSDIIGNLEWINDILDKVSKTVEESHS